VLREYRPVTEHGSLAEHAPHHYAPEWIAVWIPVFMGELNLISGFTPRDWHVHEMALRFFVGGHHGLSVYGNPQLDGAAAAARAAIDVPLALWIASVTTQAIYASVIVAAIARICAVGSWEVLRGRTFFFRARPTRTKPMKQGTTSARNIVWL
jgi:hypothetical protein